MVPANRLSKGRREPEVPVNFFGKMIKVRNDGSGEIQDLNSEIKIIFAEGENKYG